MTLQNEGKMRNIRYTIYNWVYFNNTVDGYPHSVFENLHILLKYTIPINWYKILIRAVIDP